MARAATVAALGALLLVVSACGGGDDGGLSAEEYRAQVGEICVDFQRQLDELGSPQDLDEIPEYVERAIPLVEQEVEAVRAIEPPEEMEEDVDRMLAAADETVEAAEELRAAAEEGDERGVRDALEKGNAASDEADRIALELGLDECAD